MRERSASHRRPASLVMMKERCAATSAPGYIPILLHLFAKIAPALQPKRAHYVRIISAGATASPSRAARGAPPAGAPTPPGSPKTPRPPGSPCALPNAAKS
jgi:hypothetical protein